MKKKITFSQLMNNHGKGKFKQPLNCVVCNKGDGTGGDTIDNLLLDKNGYTLLDSFNNKLIVRTI